MAPFAGAVSAMAGGTTGTVIFTLLNVATLLAALVCAVTGRPT